jgi:ATP-binding cassette, subfamily B (MDR/TAP), member 11
LSTGNL